jgi:hypothetical protein
MAPDRGMFEAYDLSRPSATRQSLYGPLVRICGDCCVGNLRPAGALGDRIETESDSFLEARRTEIRFRLGTKLACLPRTALPETGENLRGLSGERRPRSRVPRQWGRLIEKVRTASSSSA